MSSEVRARQISHGPQRLYRSLLLAAAAGIFDASDDNQLAGGSTIEIQRTQRSTRL
jgi:ABC-type cobalamin transport system ATPase subunit